MFTDQLNRIKSKLGEVKVKDKDLKNFGVDYHQYTLHTPLTEHAVKQFELQYNIELPLDFIFFLTKFGNGGPGHFGGAGPFYGLYPLGNFGYMIGCKHTMRLPCFINSQLTPEQWKEATAFAEDDEAEGIEFDKKYDALFGGMLPLGTQGCNFQTMLVLNGDTCGRVVTIDQDLRMPILDGNKNFLDWYESWLDRLLTNSNV